MSASSVTRNEALWSTLHDADYIQIAGRSVITFGRRTADIWRIQDVDPPIAHIAVLSPWIEYRCKDYLIIDDDIGIMAAITFETTFSIWIYDLDDGSRLRRVMFGGRIRGWPMLYADGTALVAVHEMRQDEDDLLNTILLCEIIGAEGDDYPLNGVTYPGISAPHFNPLYPIHFSPAGDIVSVYTEAYSGEITLLRWDGPVTTDDRAPDATLDIPITDPDLYDLLDIICGVAMGGNVVLVAVAEVMDGTMAFARSPRTVMYAVDWASLRVLWRFDTVYGTADTIRHVSACDVVVGMGSREAREGNSAHNLCRFVAVWDAHTGVLRRLDSIHLNDYRGGPCYKGPYFAVEDEDRDPLLCRLTLDEENPYIVVVLKDGGHISVTSLEAFIENGFERLPDGKLVTSMGLTEEASVVLDAAAGERSIFVVSQPTIETTGATFK